MVLSILIGALLSNFLYIGARDWEHRQRMAAKKARHEEAEMKKRIGIAKAAKAKAEQERLDAIQAQKDAANEEQAQAAAEARETAEAKIESQIKASATLRAQFERDLKALESGGKYTRVSVGDIREGMRMLWREEKGGEAHGYSPSAAGSMGGAPMTSGQSFVSKDPTKEYFGKEVVSTAGKITAIPGQTEGRVSGKSWVSKDISKEYFDKPVQFVNGKITAVPTRILQLEKFGSIKMSGGDAAMAIIGGKKVVVYGGTPGHQKIGSLDTGRSGVWDKQGKLIFGRVQTFGPGVKKLTDTDRAFVAGKWRTPENALRILTRQAPRTLKEKELKEKLIETIIKKKVDIDTRVLLPEQARQLTEMKRKKYAEEHFLPYTPLELRATPTPSYFVPSSKKLYEQYKEDYKPDWGWSEEVATEKIYGTSEVVTPLMGVPMLPRGRGWYFGQTQPIQATGRGLRRGGRGWALPGTAGWTVKNPLRDLPKEFFGKGKRGNFI